MSITCWNNEVAWVMLAALPPASSTHKQDISRYTYKVTVRKIYLHTEYTILEYWNWYLRNDAAVGDDDLSLGGARLGAVGLDLLDELLAANDLAVHGMLTCSDFSERFSVRDVIPV
jgi:hypothetical protein